MCTENLNVERNFNFKKSIMFEFEIKSLYGLYGCEEVQ